MTTSTYVAPQDDKVEITYTDPQEQFLEEMREKLGFKSDAELADEEA